MFNLNLKDTNMDKNYPNSFPILIPPRKTGKSDSITTINFINLVKHDPSYLDWKIKQYEFWKKFIIESIQNKDQYYQYSVEFKEFFSDIFSEDESASFMDQLNFISLCHQQFKDIESPKRKGNKHE